ncbi:MAG TPA: DNA polymerase III subunit gamma and tau [Actinomycetales bacterium]|nr:DNA polymerase III subunit gamma and tau [Actinomycetales bacterium]
MPTALYRRYRPETFVDVIGQEHVTEPLMQALRSGRVNHAYLFSGPRGCGKTTSARILARCLNCEQGPTPTPCGTCDSCVGLSRGGAGTVDVIEIDAASHGGVDDARDLREKASFGPASSRYKVYIIDEAHMVTPQGFNALLKIVEEPPEHVVFVFATTAPEKVIGTIRSRTHHYPFRLVPPARLQDYLASLCESEGVVVEKGVLPLVVRAGGGSVRDSLSVLDQLIAGSGGSLTYAGAVALLGYTDAALLDDVVEAFAAGDGAAVYRVVDRVVESGHEPRRFVEDLLERLRDLLVISAVPDGAHTVLRGLPEDQLERMRQQASRFGAAELTRAADVVNAGLTELTGATSPRLQLELVCARVLLPGADGEHGYAARLDRLERRLGAGAMSEAASGDEAPGSGRAAAREAARAATTRTTPADGSSSGGRPAPSSRDTAAGEAEREPAPPADARPQARATPASPQSHAGPVPVPPVSRQPAPASPAPTGGQPARPPAPPPDPAPEPTPVSPPSGQGGVDVETIRRVWPDVVERLKSMRKVTWMIVSDHARVAAFDGRRLVLALRAPGPLANFRSGAHADFVQQALIDVLGVDATVDAVAADGEDDVDAGPVARSGVVAAAPEGASRPPMGDGRRDENGRDEGWTAPSSGPRSAPEPPDPSGEPEGWEPVAPAAVRPEPQAGVRPGSGQPGSGQPGSGQPGGGARRDQRRPAPEPDPTASPTTPRVPLVDAADDEPSPDDVDAADSGLVGRPVVEQLLGGRVIDETDA